jgi:hypothetical protein
MSNWDSEIDDVARQMTGSASQGRFTDRVLAQLDEGTLPRRRAWPMWTWSPVALVAAATVAALLVRATWRSHRPEMRPEGAAVSVRLKPDPTNVSPGSRNVTPDLTKIQPDARGSSNTASSFRSVQRERPVGSDPSTARAEPVEGRGAGFIRTSGAVTQTASRTGPAAQFSDANDLIPPLLEIDSIGVDSMDTMESIEITRLAIVDALEVPPIGDE